MEVLLPVKDDGFGFDFSVFDIDFVTAEDDWNIFTDSDEISVPVGYIFIGDPRHTGGKL